MDAGSSAAAVEMTAVEPIKSGGRRVEPGESFSVPASVAETLEGLGVAQRAQAPATRKRGKGKAAADSQDDA